ncbi:MAG: hypothetical protein WCC80_04370, partial [Pseudolabrys sp.]
MPLFCGFWLFGDALERRLTAAAKTPPIRSLRDYAFVRADGRVPNMQLRRAKRLPLATHITGGL